MKLFEVFNGFNTALLDENPIVEAKNARQAIEKVLKDFGIKYKKLICSGNSWVKMQAQPICYINGYKYKDGRASWWEVW